MASGRRKGGGPSLNRNELVLAVAQAMGREVKETDETVVQALHQILLSLGRHESVLLMGFGSFRVRRKPSRMARNPRTGEMVKVSEKFAISFRPSKLMKQFVNSSPKVGTSNLTLAHPKEPKGRNGR
jgi:nucleoid DNA-binding protein